MGDLSKIALRFDLIFYTKVGMCMRITQVLDFKNLNTRLYSAMPGQQFVLRMLVHTEKEMGNIIFCHAGTAVPIKNVGSYRKRNG
jgi:hypothetical protein